jgi:hypothetical protein
MTSTLPSYSAYCGRCKIWHYYPKGGAKNVCKKKAPVKTLISQDEFLARVQKYSEENQLVAQLLKQVGSPDKWPKHLQEDLIKRVGCVRSVTMYEVADEPNSDR